MMAHFRSNSLQPSDHDMIADLQQRLMDLAHLAVNKPRIELFGSHASGFCKPRSDVDVSLQYRNFSPWLCGMPHADRMDEKRLTRLSREAAAAGMEQVRYIRAVIPVVQFVDSVSGIHCDVSIGNVGGVGELAHPAGGPRHFPRTFYGAYIHTVKEWAKAREVVAPEKVTFNSFTMTVMALMVLQELGLLPIFAAPTGALGELTHADVARALADFRLPPIYDELRASRDDERIGEAVYFCFQKFAEYYTKFDFANGSVSLLHPRRHRELYRQTADAYLRRFTEQKRAEWVRHMEAQKPHGLFDERSFENSIRDEVAQRVSHTPFVVEDFVNYVNCGRRTAPSCVRHVMEELQQLRDALTVGERDLSWHKLTMQSHKLPSAFAPAHEDKNVKLFRAS
ncbi:hypothetical protein STCU_02679 [Strigomonas culicis]|uniref:RNA uridylyltransferase n=1 Tax=Strigomonas culicis TaxID=28005 RepID=S9UV29_9TRYP|nr:hypothetical protein STCU_02679 [Strigomonas culicis]|eukprot:EPY32758.1 hypothetical protein STCU_02679 [Strigomonas culicis]